MPEVFIFFFVIFFGAILVVVFNVIKAMRQNRQNQASEQQASQNLQSQSRANQSVTVQQTQRRAPTRHEQHVQDSHAHGHVGEEEHYEEIIGSLGDINDEGCADLNGVRFIAHDLAYDSDNGNKPDYNKLAKAMVLGEVLNNPRFKKPYGRK